MSGRARGWRTDAVIWADRRTARLLQIQSQVTSRALCGQIESEWPDNGCYMFISERGAPMTDEAFRKMLRLAAAEADISRELVNHKW